MKDILGKLLTAVFNLIVKIISSAIVLVLFRVVYEAVMSVIRYIKARIAARKRKKELDEMKFNMLQEQVNKIAQEQEEMVRERSATILSEQAE